MAPVRAPRRETVVDAAIALFVFALAMGMLASGRFHPSGTEGRDLDLIGVVLAALASLPLAVRRPAPLPVYGLTTAATAALYGLAYSFGPPVGAAIALYEVASSAETRARPRLTRVVVVGFLLALATTHVATRGFASPELLLGTLVWGGAWIAGDRARQRRERIAELEERAERAEREAERERRLAAAEERTRIARDLHDSAGHAVNVILVQAGAARLLHERDPEGSREALETIEQVARETIGEIDRLVRVLRDDSDSGSPPAGAVEPPPGLAALDTLAERHRAAGLDVTVTVRGPRRPLAPRVDRAAYRILQEALTNAAVHGTGAAEVDVAFGLADLEITVTNPVRSDGALRPGGGHGLVGMRERTALLGGSLAAGAENGRFRVWASFPYGEAVV